MSENEIVAIDAWEVMEVRPNFVPTLDPSGSGAKLTAILGKYHLEPAKACCLTSCGTPHNHGGLVRTEDGRETYIGWRCGKAHFEDQWDSILRDYKQAKSSRELRQRFESHLAAVDQYEARMVALDEGPRGTRWFAAIRDSLYAQLPKPCWNEFIARAARGDATLTVEEEVPQSERDFYPMRRNAAGQIERYITRVVGTLDGLPALSPLDDARELLRVVKRITHGLTKAAAAGETKYLALVREADAVPLRLDRVEFILRQAELFFTDSNLAQLVKLESASRERLLSVRLADRGAAVQVTVQRLRTARLHRHTNAED